MSKMPIVNSLGLIEVVNNSLTASESEHPVWKARNAIALEKGKWLYAPEKGHELGVYARDKQTPEKAEEFAKSAALYLKGYGPQVVETLVSRGAAEFKINITKETINGDGL